jgi:hypothetical protein
MSSQVSQVETAKGPHVDKQGERIQANCAKIWGAHRAYELDIQTDDYKHYQCFVREDFGDEYSTPLIMTLLCTGEEAAWHELDCMLSCWAGQNESGQLITREKKLEIVLEHRED